MTTRINVSFNNGSTITYTTVARVLSSITRYAKGSIELQVDLENADMIETIAQTDSRYSIRVTHGKNYLPPSTAILFSNTSVARTQIPGLRAKYQTKDVRVCTAPSAA